jgi:hypothetical protein
LVTHRRPDGRYERYAAAVPAAAVRFDTSRADLTLGASAVRQRGGVYAVTGQATGADGTVRFDLDVQAASNRYFPPVELREDDFLSGYVVPGLAASASGRICVATRCTHLTGARAYHDHNWGVWRDVTWEWGAATGRVVSVLYGGVYGPGGQSSGGGTAITSPFFLTLVDSLGVRQVLRFDRVHYEGEQAAAGIAGARAPRRFTIVGTRERDSVTLAVDVEHALATDMNASSMTRIFLQMRGRFTLNGGVAGETVNDGGEGFFDTYRSR